MTGKRITFPLSSRVSDTVFQGRKCLSSARLAGATAQVSRGCPSASALPCSALCLLPALPLVRLKKYKIRKKLTSTSAEIPPKHLTTDSTALLKQQNKNPNRAKQRRKPHQNIYSLVSPGRKELQILSPVNPSLAITCSVKKLQMKPQPKWHHCPCSDHYKPAEVWDLEKLLQKQIVEFSWATGTALKMELMVHDLQFPEILATPAVPLPHRLDKNSSTLDKLFN